MFVVKFAPYNELVVNNPVPIEAPVVVKLLDTSPLLMLVGVNGQCWALLSCIVIVAGVGDDLANVVIVGNEIKSVSADVFNEFINVDGAPISIGVLIGCVTP